MNAITILTASSFILMYLMVRPVVVSSSKEILLLPDGPRNTQNYDTHRLSSETSSTSPVISLLRPPSLIQRLISSRLDPLLFVPIFNWQMSRINFIVESAGRCLRSPLCHRMIQHADLMMYERNWRRKRKWFTGSLLDPGKRMKQLITFVSREL